MCRKLFEFCENNKLIFCYGAGRYGRIVRNYLFENEVDIEGYIISGDVDEKEVLGKPVFSIKNIDIKAEDVGIIICGKKRVSCEIEEILRNLSFENYFIPNEDTVEDMDRKSKYDNIFCEKGKKHILLYHRIYNITPDIWGLGIDPLFFRWQMQYLKNNYEVVSFDHMNFEDDKEQVAITFDDGYFDNYENAFPILKENGIPATFFVAIGNIEKRKEFWWNEIDRMIYFNSACEDSIEFEGVKYDTSCNEMRKETCWKIRNELKKYNYEKRYELLEKLSSLTNCREGFREECRVISKTELREMDMSPLITIGGHTITHSSLSILDKKEKEKEIKESKNYLENILGHEIKNFAFPFGRVIDYDMDSIEIARNVGYEHIAAVDTKYFSKEWVKWNPKRKTVVFDSSNPPKEQWKREFMRFMTLS